ncbi:hypothetical protein BGX30_004042, partial [Mortierella sp. GBA39]
VVGAKTDLPAGSFKEQPGSQTVGAIQQTTAEERDDDDDEKEDEGDNDTSMRFAGGYIRHWRKEAERLLPAMRPLFCLRHKFTDPFITFEERALPPILRSTSKKNPNPCSAAASKIIFYGEPDDQEVTFLTVERKELHATRVPFPCRQVSSHRIRPYARNDSRSTTSFRQTAWDPMSPAFYTTKPYRSISAFIPIYRIDNRFPTLQSILDEFGVSSIEEIDVWGIDPGEVNRAAFCRVLRTYLTSIDTNVATDDDASTNSTLPPSLEAKNLVVSRRSLCQPVFVYRQKMEDLSTTRITVSPGQTIEGKLWAEQKYGQADGRTSIPSISEILNVLPSRQYQQVADMEQSTFRFFLVQDILHGFYGSARVKAMDWDLKRVKKAEMNLAIDAILRECTTKALFCYGNGFFRRGINLASPHESFKAVFAQKAVAAGHIVVLVDE